MIICIDAGHGGSNTGTLLLNKYKEKDFNFLIALKLTDILMQNGHTVILTRTSDINVSKATRRKRGVGSDVVISLHTNAHPLATALHGFETFYWHTNEKGKLLAQLLLDNAPQELKRLTKPHKIDPEFNWSSGAKSIITTYAATTILIEMGYASNTQDRKFLNNEKNHDKIINGIAKAIMTWSEFYG